MAKSTAEILTSVKARRARHRGIALASDYVSTIGSAMGDRKVERFFGMGSDKAWKDAVDKASSKLVYHGNGMLPANSKRVAKKESPEVGKACMVFDCVMTSTKRDRDKDILEPKGARIDPVMPLLWQHLPMNPIGKLVKVLEQTDEVVKVQCAIADNAFGRDVAQLVEFGGLRISHGFVPTSWEPIQEDDPDAAPAGWHVLKYDVLEISVVSIPSNTDAVIEAWETSKLHHPLVKAWASGVSSGRVKVFSTGGKNMAKKKGDERDDDLDTKAAPPTVNVHVHLEGVKAGKADDEGKDDEEVKEEPEAASELASMGRVHLLMEQAMAAENLEESKKLLGQAKTELEACMAAEKGEEPEGEADDESEEEKDDEADDEDDEDKDPHQYVMEDDEADEEKEQAEGEDDVEPGDSEGRDDEDEGKDFASEMFEKMVAEAKAKKKPSKQSEKKPAKKPVKK